MSAAIRAPSLTAPEEMGDVEARADEIAELEIHPGGIAARPQARPSMTAGEEPRSSFARSLANDAMRLRYLDKNPATRTANALWWIERVGD